MSKRKFDDMEDTSDKQPLKNSLDSDEDDDEVNEDTYNIMNEDEFEGISNQIYNIIQINQYVIFIIFIIVNSYFVQVDIYGIA